MFLFIHLWRGDWNHMNSKIKKCGPTLLSKSCIIVKNRDICQRLQTFVVHGQTQGSCFQTSWEPFFPDSRSLLAFSRIIQYATTIRSYGATKSSLKASTESALLLCRSWAYLYIHLWFSFLDAWYTKSHFFPRKHMETKIKMTTMRLLYKLGSL